MSQTGNSLLDDVGSWSADQCREELSNTLPKLIIYGNGASTDKKITVLRTLVTSFLPHISLDVLEEQLLSKILPQTQILFDKIISDVTKHLESESTQSSSTAKLQNTLMQCLQCLVSMIEILGSCVHQVTSLCKNYGTVSMDQIQSLPSTALNIVKGSFSHCKDSNELYGDYFSSVSEPLSSLFKKAYGLQKSLMALLDAVQMSEQDGDDVIGKMVQVCDGFHELCIIISSMDSTLMVSTWRFLVKLASKHKDLLKDGLEVSSLIKSLCSDIESNYEHCLQIAPLQPGISSSQRDGKAFAKTLKICNLCLKMLMHLLKEFDGYIRDCHKSLYHLVIVLQSLAPPSVHAPLISSGAKDELNKSLLICIEPLLQQLLPNKQFCEAVLISKQDLSKTQWFSRLQTLLHLLRLLPNASADIQAHWLAPTVFPEDEPRESVFKAVFTTISKCHVEFNVPVYLPSIMCNGQAQRNVSLHEYVTTHLCGYVASVPAAHFGIVERALLTSVLDSDINMALTAMDVWCFLARYGTAALCFTHVKLIASLLNSLPTNSNPAYMHLCMLLRRLIPLMTPEDQTSFTSLYPVQDNLTLWTHLPLLAFPEASKQELCQQIGNTAIEHCQGWMHTETKTLGSLSKVTTALNALCSVYRHYDSSQPPITTRLQDAVKNMVCQLWQELPLDKITSHDLMSTLISLSGLMLQGLNPEELNNILCEIQKLLQYDKTSVQVRIVTTDFLRRIGKKNIPPCTQQSKILQGISGAFSKLLSDKHWVVHQMALQAFSVFAEETSHESVVPECLQNETVQGLAVNFLSKEPRPYNSEASEVDLLEAQLIVLSDFAVKQQEYLQNVKSIVPVGNQLSISKTNCASEEPATKRAKYDDSDLQEAIKQVKQGLKRIKELKDVNHEKSQASWFVDELRMIKDQVVSLLPKQ
ncbi:FIGNL1-interacting regulator of recombination and mitosis-like [Amphiura filiformis]|uniref:FIGNL1-interacting regulator of recombination and mitosis-like n=1 Tax=Amphiura filiformis TaxID=82378 RepID=UPI003B21DBC2